MELAPHGRPASPRLSLPATREEQEGVPLQGSRRLPDDPQGHNWRLSVNCQGPMGGASIYSKEGQISSLVW